MPRSRKPVPDCYEVRNSPIHNLGVYAAKDLAEGDFIVEYVGEKITKTESNRRGLERLEKSKLDGSASVYIFTLNKRYDLDGDVPENPAKLINHSCDPNCYAEIIRGKIWIIALRAIAEGEELTFDYGYDIESFLDHPCRCGSEKCVGFIVSQEQWPRLYRMKAYREWKAKQRAKKEAAKKRKQAAKKARQTPAKNERRTVARKAT